jgi:hypothetical protein
MVLPIKMTVILRPKSSGCASYRCDVYIEIGTAHVRTSETFNTHEQAWRQAHNWRKVSQYFVTEFEFIEE